MPDKLALTIHLYFDNVVPAT